MERTVELRTADGVSEAYLMHPDGKGPWPAVVHLMDGLGIRPGFLSVSRRIAEKGYCVVVPHLYYRDMPKPRELDRETEMELLMKLLGNLTRERGLRDIDAAIAFLDTEPAANAGRVGIVGYCMSGSHALAGAANRPDRIVAGLSFHGGRLATDSPDSPHRLAARMKGRIYCGVAQDDFDKDPCETARLRGAFEAAGTRAEVELYAGCKHGWTIPGWVYDQAGSERHFETIFRIFGETLN